MVTLNENCREGTLLVCDGKFKPNLRKALKVIDI